MWQIVPGSHTMHCCDPVQPFMSDRANFSWDFRLLAATIDENDPVLNSAQKRHNHIYKVTLDQWKSGLGEKFDKIVLGKKENHARRAKYAKKVSETKQNLQALPPSGETFPQCSLPNAEHNQSEFHMLTHNSDTNSFEPFLQ